jgi:hypothetical protein
VGLDAHEHILKIGERVDAVGLAGGDQRVDPGDVLAGILVADEQEVLAARGDVTVRV